MRKLGGWHRAGTKTTLPSAWRGRWGTFRPSWHPTRVSQRFTFVTPQRVSIISMEVSDFPINLQTKLILMTLMSLNGIITISTLYASFVRWMREYFQKIKPKVKWGIRQVQNIRKWIAYMPFYLYSETGNRSAVNHKWLWHMHLFWDKA